MSVLIRPADSNDALALAGLRWRWRVEERGENGLTRPEFEGAFAAWMADHQNTHRVWLAQAAGSVIGMAWLAVIERIPGPQRRQRLSGFLQSVYVIPERRGAGVGRRLVNAAVAAADGLGLDYVSVHPSEKSFSLYRRAGFGDYPGVLELRFDSI
ncbi:MAG TPA: GNAT family N-acetyltransferase [Mycobacteriales bacterium]|nr:GNAT family N-acetyltransferase [Mycobacteriales bacterium]